MEGKKVHPRLFYFSEDIARFRKQLQSDSELAEKFYAFEKKAQPLMTSAFYSEEYANSVYSQHGKYYDLGDQLTAYGEQLGFLYQVTGKKEYAEKIREALLHYCSFQAWTGPANRDRRIPWQSDLSTTKMAYGYALCLDCIADILSEKEEMLIIDTLFQKGILPLLRDWVLPESRIHALDSMGHNWWAVCIGMAAVSLAAVYEKIPDSSEYLKLAARALKEFMEYPGNRFFHKVSNFDADGMFYESANYFNYGIGEWMRAAFVMKHCLLDETLADMEILKSAGEAAELMVYELSENEDSFLTVNFGDSNIHASFDLFYGYLLLSGTCSHRERIKYCYSKMKKEYTALDLIYYDILRKSGSEREGKPTDGANPPAFRCLENYLFMRSPERVNGTLFSARCGNTWNHAHEDAGSFLLFDRGKPLLTESGSAPSYGHSTYLDYYVQSRAHNVLLVGEGQYHGDIFRGIAFPGNFPIRYEDGRIAYALADATGPMSSLCDRNYRSFLKLAEDIFLIIDDVHTYRPEEMAFLLHFRGKETIRNGGVQIRNEASTVEADFYSEEQLHIEKRSGYGECQKGQMPQKEDYLAAKFKQKLDHCMLMTLLRLNEAGQETEMTYTPGTLMDELVIQRGKETGCQFKIYLNKTADGSELHMNSIIRIKELETDAYLLILWEENKDRGYAMIGGSILRDAGKGKIYVSQYRKGQSSGRL